jgi:anti-sigma B factor antagonist
MFSVELSVSDFGGHAVVALRGELDLADVPAVESHLIAAVAACGASVIVDMAGLEFIDCCGLGVLVRVLKWARESGGAMSLAAPPQHVRRILRLTGLIGAFPVYPSVEHAARGATWRPWGQDSLTKSSALSVKAGAAPIARTLWICPEGSDMPLFGLEFIATGTAVRALGSGGTGTAIRRLGEVHRIPPKPTFTLGLDS